MSNALKLIHQKVAMPIRLYQTLNHLDRIHRSNIHQSRRTQMKTIVNSQSLNVTCTNRKRITMMTMTMMRKGNDNQAVSEVRVCVFLFFWIYKMYCCDQKRVNKLLSKNESNFLISSPTNFQIKLISLYILDLQN